MSAFKFSEAIVTKDFTGSAIYSKDEKHRFVLSRYFSDLDEDKGKLVFIMLNPSTATEEINDPTVSRCCSYSRLWGYKTMSVINLYSLRATNPKELWSSEENNKEPYNYVWIQAELLRADRIICAWGNNAKQDRVNQMSKIIMETVSETVPIETLQINSTSGYPAHPLYLKKNIEPLNYREYIKEFADEGTSQNTNSI